MKEKNIGVITVHNITGASRPIFYGYFHSSFSSDTVRFYTIYLC